MMTTTMKTPYIDRICYCRCYGSDKAAVSINQSIRIALVL